MQGSRARFTANYSMVELWGHKLSFFLNLLTEGHAEDVAKPQ